MPLAVWLSSSRMTKRFWTPPSGISCTSSNKKSPFIPVTISSLFVPVMSAWRSSSKRLKSSKRPKRIWMTLFVASVPRPVKPSKHRAVLSSLSVWQSCHRWWRTTRSRSAFMSQQIWARHWLSWAMPILVIPIPRYCIMPIFKWRRTRVLACLGWMALVNRPWLKPWSASLVFYQAAIAFLIP